MDPHVIHSKRQICKYTCLSVKIVNLPIHVSTASGRRKKALCSALLLPLPLCLRAAGASPAKSENTHPRRPVHSTTERIPRQASGAYGGRRGLSMLHSLKAEHTETIVGVSFPRPRGIPFKKRCPPLERNPRRRIVSATLSRRELQGG
uniref:Uncharacterized protein n=1 Tax=Leersia perrieri TaxID=77586 RepID=A0A0D9XWI8_9ORYZ